MTRVTNLLSYSLLFLCLLNTNIYAIEQETVSQLSQMTGVKQNRTAKIVELHETLTSASSLSRAGKYEDAVSQAEKITAETGFNADDIKQAKATLFEIHKRAGNYEMAVEVGKELVRYHPVFNLWRDEATVLLSCQQDKCDQQLIDQFIKEFYKEKKVVLPPNGHDLMALAVLVRVYEVANKIDQAFELVNKYHGYYFSKKMLQYQNAIINRQREGLELLKQALDRDEQENKNIYAQELINTTDYFGFV